MSHTRCQRCGKTRRAHCDYDEPGLDHEPDCPKRHHEFRPAAPPPAPAGKTPRRCVGYEGGCDGDLVGQSHAAHCPCAQPAPSPDLRALAEELRDYFAEQPQIGPEGATVACMWFNRLAAALQRAQEGKVSSERLSSRWQELFWALPPGEMRHKLRALEIDMGRALREHSPTPPPPAPAGERPVEAKTDTDLLQKSPSPDLRALADRIKAWREDDNQGYQDALELLCNLEDVILAALQQPR